MAQLSIPDEYRVGFKALRNLKGDQAQQLSKALREVPPVRSRRGLRASVASRVGGVERSELNEVLDALISLLALRDNLGMSISELVGAIADAMDESEFGDLGFPDGESRQAFEGLLTDALTVESFGLAAKAISLAYEQDHIVHSFPRVFTDIRPIFDSDLAEPSLRGAMVTYALKLEYHEGSRVQELFLDLSAGQVDALIEALERAKAKAENLKEFLEKSDIDYVEAE
jgi:hypothetical protein